MIDAAAGLALVWAGPGATPLRWERGTRCDCWAQDTHQPTWGHEPCGGLGVVYAAAVEVRGLFRSQSKWTGLQPIGELPLGEAQLTVPSDAKPGYTDHRVRDRYTLPAAIAEQIGLGRVFYPAAEPVEFVFGGALRAWRVQLQSLEQANRVVEQP